MSRPSLRILLAAPRSFCAGVTRAIQTVEAGLEHFGAPLYVRHAIVHNEHVVRAFEARGVVFVEALSEVPDGAPVIFSAHGIPPQVRAEASRRGLQTVDATCPLVAKVHQEAVRHERAGHFVLVIGKAQHAEVVGITGHLSPENYQTIASTEDAERVAVPAHRSVAYVTQTTLSVDDTRQIVRALRRRFPQLQEPRKDTICYATSNRQWAVRTIAPQVEGLLVLGSATSSNSIRLTEVAQQAGCAHVRLVPDPSQFRASSLDHIRKLGITAGASAPEELVRALIQRITAHRACSIREITTAEERVQFRLPTEFSEAPASFA